jgi:hypothetical protein
MNPAGRGPRFLVLCNLTSLFLIYQFESHRIRKRGPEMRLLSSRARKSIYVCAFAVALCAFPFTSSALAIGHGHGFVYGGFYPAYDWGWGWGWGGPFWGDFTWAPYYWDYTGTVKLENVDKSDSVYINGSYAGKAGKLHTIYLDPGSYRVTVENNGKNLVDQRVYVITGNTVKLNVGDKRGAIKLKDADKNDHVYLNGSYEGEAGNLKTLPVDPGTYKVIVTNNGREVFDQQVSVPTNRTVHVTVRDGG